MAGISNNISRYVLKSALLLDGEMLYNPIVDCHRDNWSIRFSNFISADRTVIRRINVNERNPAKEIIDLVGGHVVDGFMRLYHDPAGMEG
jgi:hypothetical protein